MNGHFMIDREELINREKIILDRATQMLCSGSKEAIALRDRINGILFVIADKEFPDNMETVFISNNDPQFKYFNI